MTTRNSGMYAIHDDFFSPPWTVFVICTIIGDGNKEHGWTGEGETEVKAIDDLQKAMRAAK